MCEKEEEEYYDTYGHDMKTEKMTDKKSCRYPGLLSLSLSFVFCSLVSSKLKK